MEKNVHLIATHLRWPPGSWDHLSIRRASRIFEAVAEYNKDHATTLSLEDLSE